MMTGQVKNSMKAQLLTSMTLAALLSGCTMKVAGPSDSAVQTNSVSGSNKLAVNVNKYSSAKLVCNPLDPTTPPPTTYEKGIMVDLFYKTAAMPIMHKSTDYVQFAQKSDQKLFLTDMNIPTRLFTEGFSNSSGASLKDDQGAKLIEYFGLKMKTNLMLTDLDEAGDYELALLSDDGATLTVKSGTGTQADDKLIDNDGDHETRMGCSTHTIPMRSKVMLPIEVSYYQGPRYHIANVLMWRKIDKAGTDPLCGRAGNGFFYNPDNKSAPQQAVKDLESRGWKVVQPDNFVVSATKEDYNPCVSGTDPVISNFKVGEVILTQVNLTWSTDIPATSQVQLTNMKTGEITTTTSDNILRTDNNVVLTNLQQATTYKAQAISVSEDLGRSISSEVSFTTQ